MKIFMMIFVFTTFSTLSMGADSTPEERVSDEFTDAKLASEVMLYEADKLKEIDREKDLIKSNRIGKSILGRYIDKKILEVKAKCEKADIKDEKIEIKKLAAIKCSDIAGESTPPLCAPPTSTAKPTGPKGGDK